jgi:predicted phage baseplate assembly protein
MSLVDLIPKIDDRRYSDILAEVRTRIARYTPEWTPVWTDVNDSDPGYTLVQVFAWLSEMLTYRMNLVPQLNYLKFLQLIGIELIPARPAEAQITFPVTDTFPQAYTLIPLGTQISADAADGGAPVIFETQKSITALAIRLESLQAFDGYTFLPVNEENKQAVDGFQPFGPRPRDDAALYFGFSYPSGSPLVDFPGIDFGLAFFIKSTTDKPSPFACGPADSAVIPPARLMWEFWDSKNWRSLDMLKDETAAFTRSGQVYLKLPSGLKAKPLIIGADATPRFWLRARLQRTRYERPPTLLAVRTNTASAIQAETIQFETLGGSNGRRDQVFTLSETPVLPGSLDLQVDDGQGFASWTEVGDFFGSAPDDKVSVINRTSGEVRFGDGVNGSIPAGNETSPNANILALKYRVGGGKRGNVAAGKIKTLVSSVDGIDPSGVSNLLAAVGGQNEETLDEAVKRAPISLKSRSRAVTLEDFEQFAMQAANIKRAHAIALFHPSFPNVKVPGVVSVIVVPDSEDNAPIPAEGTLRAVCEFLDTVRLLTTEVYVLPPEYHLVCVRADLIASDTADLAEVKTGVETSLLTYFHPLKGGEDGQGWPFGGRIFYSRVIQRVFSVRGVLSVEQLTILIDGETVPAYQDIPLPDNGLAYSTRHEINVMYEFEAIAQP